MASIASDQIRAARALLRLSVAELAEKSAIGVATIKRIEATTGLPSANVKTIDSIVKALEAMGIEFIGNVNDDPGVRLKIGKS